MRPPRESSDYLTREELDRLSFDELLRFAQRRVLELRGAAPPPARAIRLRPAKVIDLAAWRRARGRLP